MIIAPGPFMCGPPGFIFIVPSMSETVEIMSTPLSTIICDVYIDRGCRILPRLAGVSGVSGAVFGHELGDRALAPEQPGKNSDAIMPLAEKRIIKCLAARAGWAWPKAVAARQMGLVSDAVNAPMPPSRRRRLSRVR